MKIEWENRVILIKLALISMIRKADAFAFNEF